MREDFIDALDTLINTYMKDGGDIHDIIADLEETVRLQKELAE